MNENGPLNVCRPIDLKRVIFFFNKTQYNHLGEKIIYYW